MLRFLAYGGTGYVQRLRMGIWPPIPNGTLQDLYGLLPGKRAYGLGILDGQPFLVIRERQNAHSRGGYAYTLLLDPGEEIWQSFGWNAAWLLSEILNNPIACKLLLSEPEKCTPQAFEEIFGALQTIPNSWTYTDQSYDGVALWVGAIRSPGQVVVDPARFGIEDFFTPNTLASVLNQLPLCFRCGMGWLVGAGQVHGAYLGAKLIINAERSCSAQDVEELVLRGHATLEGFRTLTSRSQYYTIAQTLSRTPVWKWQLDVARFLNTLESLGSHSSMALSRESLNPASTPAADPEATLRHYATARRG